MKTLLYDWFGFNVWLFHFINDIRSEFLDKIMLLGTELGSHKHFDIYISILIVIVFYRLARKNANSFNKEEIYLWLTPIAVIAISYLIDALFLEIIKPLLDFPRPPLALPIGSVNIVGIAEYHHSFPSGHSSFSMLIIASIWSLLFAWQKGLGVIFVLWVGISRISLGAHFPADVLAGFGSAFLIVIIVKLAIREILKSKI
ncbi:MAG: phosphatase PAP2 family protein [Aliarcobacter sp.]|nr:phosphatase PAP2 family protein [Aliarcobacter sp.]